MLTSKQIKELPKGDYPNHRLMDMFPKQQGPGRSAKMTLVKEKGDEGKPETLVTKLINFFTGKEVKPKRVHRVQSKG